MSTNNKFLDATGLKYVYDKINNKIASVESEVNNIKGVTDLSLDVERIDAVATANKTSITTLNADKDTEGSVDYKIEAAKEILRDEIKEISGSGGIDPAVLDGLRKGISDNLTAINVLNSDSNTEGSVDYKISAAIDNFKCPSTAITTEEIDEIMADE